MFLESSTKNDTFVGVGGRAIGVGEIFRRNWFGSGVTIGNCTLIVTGNLLVILAIVFQPKLRKSATNHFIASLAISDLFVGALFIPVKEADVFGIELVSSEILCDSVMTISWTCLNSTVLSLLAIAADRYRAIITPMKQQISVNQARLIIILTWLVSFCYSSNLIVVSGVVSKTVELDGQNFTRARCEYVVRQYGVGIIAATDFLLLYFIPLTVIAVLYTKMIVVLYFGNSPNDNSRRRKRRAIKMLIVVVAMFGLSWCPLRVIRILRFTIPSWATDYENTVTLRIVVTVAMANSWMNPLIYAIFSSNFRREFGNILTCRGFLKNGPKEARRTKDQQSNDKNNRKRFIVNFNDIQSSLSDRTRSDREVVAESSMATKTTSTQTDDKDISCFQGSRCYENCSFETLESENDFPNEPQLLT
ncbi:QRFP-like peptide receptor [Ptychodera flava]|uniref:QRFP-like peptide receptor n=1 Tax=Ptychodera flava TaxID=63121 RepID=UPI00396A4ACF